MRSPQTRTRDWPPFTATRQSPYTAKKTYADKKIIKLVKDRRYMAETFKLKEISGTNGTKTITEVKKHTARAEEWVAGPMKTAHHSPMGKDSYLESFQYFLRVFFLTEMSNTHKNRIV